VSRVLLAASQSNKNDSTCDTPVVQEDVPVLMRTINEGSTPVHQDHYGDDERTPVLDDVGFVFLNDNQNATFVYGSELVPAKKGTLVVFNGGVPHNSVIRSGQVNVFGTIQNGCLHEIGSFGIL
jgi:hypothetical protein